MQNARKVADRVIAAFGGPAKLGRVIGRPANTVRGWRRGRGLIPSWYHRPILAAAREEGISLAPEDLLEPASEGRLASALPPPPSPGPGASRP